MTVHILYENADWLPPIQSALDKLGLRHESWFVDQYAVDPSEEPPEGVYLNRISPSAHTRGHHHAIASMNNVLAWLERWDRPVINGSRAFELEVSKLKQLAELTRFGLPVPRTVAVAGGADALMDAAKQFQTPFITKHNMGGKGLGVQLFRSLDGFENYARAIEFTPPPDGVTLLQAYIQPPSQSITRVEIVEGEFLYAVRVDTSRGFQLCPSDACSIEDAFCPTTDTASSDDSSDDDRQSLFSLQTEPRHDIIDGYLKFCRANDIQVAGIEYVEGQDGVAYTYDVNTNTNYSPKVEEEHNLGGPMAIANLVARVLERYEARKTSLVA